MCYIVIITVKKKVQKYKTEIQRSEVFVLTLKNLRLEAYQCVLGELVCELFRDASREAH